MYGSVNCRGQIPIFSPSLASIQCSSTRLMTVRMSPCKPELSKRHRESNELKQSAEKVRGREPTGKNKNRMPGACNRDRSPWRLSTQLRNSPSPVFFLQHVTSTLLVSAGLVLSAQAQNHLTIRIKNLKKSRVQVCFNGKHTSTEALYNCLRNLQG